MLHNFSPYQRKWVCPSLLVLCPSKCFLTSPVHLLPTFCYLSLFAPTCPLSVPLFVCLSTQIYLSVRTYRLCEFLTVNLSTYDLLSCLSHSAHGAVHLCNNLPAIPSICHSCKTLLWGDMQIDAGRDVLCNRTLRKEMQIDSRKQIVCNKMFQENMLQLTWQLLGLTGSTHLPLYQSAVFQST